MDKSLHQLCDALKKIIALLTPQSPSLSFVIMTGKIHQGKTSLLRQSRMTHFPMENDNEANFFYNNEGIILELGEEWLNQSESLLAYTCKQLNHCHNNIKITGLMLCVDSRELLLVEPTQLEELCKSHTQLIERFGLALGYPIELSLIISKLDTLAGFSEFFQSEHAIDMNTPLGFSLSFADQRAKLLANFKTQFDQMIEMLGQQIINKLHPARSSVKRTLIREFPLQLASLRTPVQTIIQNISTHHAHLHTIYFTSSEQGGQSVDKLNKKIQHEYALTVQDKYLQSNNYRAYFIEGALQSFQRQTQRPATAKNRKQPWLIGLSVSVVTAALGFILYQHIETSNLLDEATKELLTYETLMSQSKEQTAALYHLSLAEKKLAGIHPGLIKIPTIEQIKFRLHSSTENTLKINFLPDLLAVIESVMANPSQSELVRYQALKVYLMFSEPEHFSEPEVLAWFNEHWKNTQLSQSKDKELVLLKKALKQRMQPISINKQMVLDTRNYLNALPSTYLFYSLAKASFPQEEIPIDVEGFDLASNQIPAYFTRAKFNTTIGKLPEITANLQRENWVLARNDLDKLDEQLEQAYVYEYTTWWKNFFQRTRPQHFQGYKQARQLTENLYRNKAMSRLITIIQENTGPDMTENGKLFNKKIAHQFTSLNLVSQSETQELGQTINELEKFLTTLSMVKDNGKTVFEITRGRFQGSAQSEPLSVLYQKAKQLPEPISSWAKQIADDTWFMFINQSKSYLNKQWQKQVYPIYQTKIANRYPFDSLQKDEIALKDFNHFFSPEGTLKTFLNENLMGFLNTDNPQWQPKELNGYIMPISADLINELIRANVISSMFFPEKNKKSNIEFSLQKISLDPMVANLQITLGNATLTDNQTSETYKFFNWPHTNAKLSLNSIDGNHFELEETGTWAFFKMLQKVNVLVDNNDSSSLEILFEINGNSGRYLLKTQNQINPFSPGVLTGFNLTENIA